MSTLAGSVLAAVRGRKKASHLEDDREPPEDLEEEDAEDEEEGKSAEEEDRDPDAEDEGDDTTAEGEDPDAQAEEEEDGKQASQETKIRRAEQGRIRAILTHPKADANPGLAAELAFGSRFYSAKEAGTLLETSGGEKGRLASRMAGKSPKIGAGPAPAASPKDRPSRIFAASSKLIEAKKGKR
ncbi:hypothetical protein [Nitratireductor sp. GCM10026969]|uniref:hypothetical protein n=1 Tax=Nitratireductor sp. GCM10026969 TaxID=3252645 RepID=UPI0036221264